MAEGLLIDEERIAKWRPGYGLPPDPWLHFQIDPNNPETPLIKEVCTNVYIAYDVTDEILANGEYLTIQDFNDVCDGATTPGQKARARKVFNVVVENIAEGPGRSEVLWLIDVNFWRPSVEGVVEKKRLIGHLLLSAQVVKDFYDDARNTGRFVSGMGPATKRVIERVIYDGGNEEFLSDFAEFMNRDQTLD